MNKTTDIIWYSEFLDDYFESIEEIEQGFWERKIDADYWRESGMPLRDFVLEKDAIAVINKKRRK